VTSSAPARGFRRLNRILLLILLPVALIGLALHGYAQGWFTPNPHIEMTGPVAGWDHWGGDAGGTRYSPLTQVTPENVWALKPAWTYHIGMIKAPGQSSPTFEATPIIAENRLYTCSGITRIVALDPETGREIWAFDPKSDNFSTYQLNCRGVTYVRDPAVAASAPCAGRIVAGTLDMRLIALDAATGRLCASFGAGGILDLRQGLGKYERGDMAVSSPPVFIDNKIVVNARVIDNMRVDVPAGAIRAFDVHSGKLAWTWNAVPPGMETARSTPSGEALVRATPNSWAPMSADPALNMIYVPMGNAAPDHFGGERRGLDYYSSSVVALDASTGKVRWRFQTVHHDLWDYDLPSQPVAFDLPTSGGVVPALAQSTKQGHIFILDRRTGKPVFPVVERPVPQAGAVPGEKLSPTQPFPANPAFIVRAKDLTEEDMHGFTPYDRGKCRDLFRSANYQGLFTPPSTRGWIQFPSFMGATNWGGVSIDPRRNILIVNTTQAAALMKLIPRQQVAQLQKAGQNVLPSTGSPYGLMLGPMLSPFGAPCNRPPWGSLIAIDLKAGKKLWEVPFGTTRDQAPFPIWLKTGVPNIGGSVITASGLVFIGAATDSYFRAFDIHTGQIVWKARLPGGGQATPMTYRLRKNGRQFVVIAAGGHKYLGTRQNDALVAYALPE
jgi:quinoprotein glucose dehydrogenase